MKKSFLTLIIFLSFTSGYSQAIELSSADEKTLIHDANAALTQKDYATAFTKFSALAEHGSSSAQYNLGAFYLNGQGVPKDDKLAFEWFGKSAMQGNSRAQQVVEKAASQGNVHAKKELRKLLRQTEPEQERPQVQPKLSEKPQTLPPEEPVHRPSHIFVRNSNARDALVYGDPTVAPLNKWGYGISAGYFISKYTVTEPLNYTINGGTYTTTRSHSYSQPGISIWLGYGDISVTASYKSGSGKINSDIQGISTFTTSLNTSETEIYARWLIRKLSFNSFTPYVLTGVIQNSAKGTGNEVGFQDVFSQKDSILMLGAGAIIPVNQNLGFRVDGKFGSDHQKRSDSYIASPGVVMNFNSQESTSAVASFTRLTVTLYSNFDAGWNGELGARYEKYSRGIGSPFSDTGVFAVLGYSGK